MQGSCFGGLGTSMKGVAANLQSGGRTISKTWQGGAAGQSVEGSSQERVQSASQPSPWTLRQCGNFALS